VQVMSALCHTWLQKVLGISTDGAASMTGRIKGLATRIQDLASPGFYRVWCLLHQVDLVMQKEFMRLMNGSFFTICTALIGFLRRQYLFIDATKSKCPDLSKTRWLSMWRFAEWMCNHRVEVLEFLDKKGPAANAIKPPPEWWVILATVRDITGAVTCTVQRLQGRETLVSEQKAELLVLCRKLTDLGRIQVTHEGFHLYDRFAISDYIVDLGSYCDGIYRAMSYQQREDIITATAECFTHVISGLEVIAAQRDENNLPADDLPAVLPHELASIDFRISHLTRLVERHAERLEGSAFWTPSAVAKIEADLRSLKLASLYETGLSAALKDFTHRTSFNAAWNTCALANRFPHLCAFVGGLATVFPNTATVESDFSVLAWEKDDHRTSLTDFSLEGILYTKQFKALNALAGRIEPFAARIVPHIDVSNGFGQTDLTDYSTV
jgi:hypothetical protein